eukprot:TRINITY_DN1106_c0_g1_i1.p1 TRINITY_DN1106_c0_g1~~TRINITY_DN1106_c0_g1_i1.p1  ORF type:complete len:419 (-),score=139.90 TRINITY_DN1106_c0_g1_i1:13-1227(-)
MSSSDLAYAPISPQEHLAAIERMMNGDDEEFDYERYKDHPIADEDWRKMPLFMSGNSVDVNDEDTEGVNVDLAALAHMDADFDPEVEADDFKRQGNDAFKRGLEYRVAALKLFTKAIKLPVKNHAKRSVYFSNRAAVNLAAQNYGNCVSDCKHAIRLDPSNIKAYFRAAKASYTLRKSTQCIEFCNLGLKQDADNAQLKAILAQAQAVLDKQKAAAKAKAERDEAAAEAAADRSVELFSMLEKYGAKLGAPRSQSQHDRRFCCRRNTNQLTCRVQLFYDEHAQSDTIESMQGDVTFREQLTKMFPPAAMPPWWDEERRYSLESVDLYCVLHQTPPLTFDRAARRAVPQRNEGRPKWERVSLDSTLYDLLRKPGYVIPGLVQLYAVVRNSTHAKAFLGTAPDDMI